MQIGTSLIFVTAIVFILNIPFGYWRNNAVKYSPQWFMAIHFPVPFVILLRIFSDIGFHWMTYIFLVTAFFGGQWTGGKILNSRKSHHEVSSCMVMDMIRALKS
jgi:cytochrome b561